MKKNKRLIMLFFITLIILFAIIYVFPNVTGALKKTEIIEYGGIQVTDDITAYFVRNEIVYFANKSGGINYFVEQGEQVRRGTKILDIDYKSIEKSDSQYQEIVDIINKYNGGESLLTDDIKKINLQIQKLENLKTEKTNKGETVQVSKIENQIGRLNQKIEYLKAESSEEKEKIIAGNISLNGLGTIPESYISQSNGVISYYVDGYESEFTPETMALLSNDKVKKLDIMVKNLVRKTTMTKEPLYKIVDNSKWYAVFWVAPENIVKYQKDKKVTLNLPKGQVDGKIYEILDDGDQWLVIIEINRYYEEFSQIRKIETKVITSDYKGLTIKNEDITTKDGEPGVFVKNKSGEYNFTPIKIITSDGEWSLVEVSCFYTDNGAKKVDTVNIYDEILKKPQ